MEVLHCDVRLLNNRYCTVTVDDLESHGVAVFDLDSLEGSALELHDIAQSATLFLEIPSRDPPDPYWSTSVQCSPYTEDPTTSESGDGPLFTHSDDSRLVCITTVVGPELSDDESESDLDELEDRYQFVAPLKSFLALLSQNKRRLTYSEWLPSFRVFCPALEPGKVSAARYITPSLVHERELPLHAVSVCDFHLGGPRRLEDGSHRDEATAWPRDEWPEVWDVYKRVPCHTTSVHGLKITTKDLVFIGDDYLGVVWDVDDDSKHRSVPSAIVLPCMQLMLL